MIKIKGLSTVVATILMLMITIALAGVAYIYASGMLTSRVAKTIDITDAGCRTGALANGYYLSIKNLDTTSAGPLTDFSLRLDGTLVGFNTSTCPSTTTIPAGGTVNCDLASAGGTTPLAGGTAGSFHKLKLIGPANAAEEPVSC